MVAVAEEQNTLTSTLGTSTGLNPLAHTSASVHGTDEATGTILDIGAVVLAHDRLDGLGGLVRVVEGDAADVVVEDMSLDDAVEKVAADEAHLTINGSSSTTDEVPLVVGVVGKGRVGVLEESDGNEPVVNPEVGNKVPDGHVVETELLDEEVQSSAHQTDTDIAQDDELSIIVLVQRAAGIKVVDTTAEAVMLALAATLTLALVVVVASNVSEEVVGPANELLEDEHEESESGCLLSEMSELVGHLSETSSLLLAGSGNEDHVTLHVASGLVVLSVGDLPAEVGYKEGRVKNPASNVVDETRIGESTVTTLVGNDPETGTEETLKHGVYGPQTSAGGGGGNVFGGHEVVPDAESGGQEDNVAEDIGVSLESGALEAVLRDGIVNVLDGKVGDLELVAVGVEHNTILGLGLGDIDLGHGRERCGRGRVAGRV